MPIHDWKCADCGNVTEFHGQPDDVCVGCGNANWQRIFSAPQIITQHASTIDYVMERNRKQYAEADANDSAAANFKSGNMEIFAK